METVAWPRRSETTLGCTPVGASAIGLDYAGMELRHCASYRTMHDADRHLPRKPGVRIELWFCVPLYVTGRTNPALAVTFDRHTVVTVTSEGLLKAFATWAETRMKELL